MEKKKQGSSSIAREDFYADDLNSKAMESLSLNDSEAQPENKVSEEEKANTGCGGMSDKNPFDALAELEEEEEKSDEKSLQEKKALSERNKELSQINARVNRMRVEQLRKRLKQYNLDTNGAKLILQKRLKAHYRRTEMKETEFNYNFYVVIDFEATCDAHPHNIRHEIIEFPAVLVSTKKKKIVGKFHSYVRPVINPKLTTFCTNLTGITQDQVNQAPLFPEVLQKFHEWMKENKLKTDMKTFAVVTDGPWDMGRFLFQQCKISKVPYPVWAKMWINIKKPFCNYYDAEKANLQGMLAKLGMSFIGQLHSGLDDAYNIARVALKLSEDGANMRVNEQISFKKPKSYDQRMLTFKPISRSNFNAMLKRKNVDPPEANGCESASDEDDEIDDEYLTDRQNSLEQGNLLRTKYEEDFPSLGAKS